jgi:hypothetical protein
MSRPRRILGDMYASVPQKVRRLLFVVGRDTRKTKVSDLEMTVRSDKEILALEVAVDAFVSMKVGKGTSNVGCKGKSETPWQWLGVVVNILTEVAYGLK